MGGWIELGACHNGARGPWREGVRGARAVDPLADDVAALNRSIERMPGPVVLAPMQAPSSRSRDPNA